MKAVSALGLEISFRQLRGVSKSRTGKKFVHSRTPQDGGSSPPPPGPGAFPSHPGCSTAGEFGSLDYPKGELKAEQGAESPPQDIWPQTSWPSCEARERRGGERRERGRWCENTARDLQPRPKLTAKPHTLSHEAELEPARRNHAWPSMSRVAPHVAAGARAPVCLYLGSTAEVRHRSSTALTRGVIQIDKSVGQQ